jgi:TRAP-type C4-dicarboxylate transport system substrate-binding protein
MASPGHLGKLIPELQLFLLHFVFSEDNRVNKEVLSTRSTLHQRFASLYDQKGLKLLSFVPEGWQVWTTRKPVRRPADFQGLKMRVMTSPMLIAAYEAYGANPTPLPYSEVYSALQLKMIDGQVNPVFAIEEMSFYEVTDYLVFANHAQFVTSVVTNPEFFDRLSSQRQAIVLESVAALNDYIFEVQRQFNATRLEKIKKRKPDIEIIRLTEPERALFREASLPVRKTFTDAVGPSGERMLEQLLAEVAGAESRLADDG